MQRNNLLKQATLYEVAEGKTQSYCSALLVRPYERYLNLYFPISEVCAIIADFANKYVLGTIIYGSLLRVVSWSHKLWCLN